MKIKKIKAAEGGQQGPQPRGSDQQAAEGGQRSKPVGEPQAAQERKAAVTAFFKKFGFTGRHS
jgi:hypothetical protein